MPKEVYVCCWVLYIESHENHEDSDLQGCDVVLLGEWFIFGKALDSLTLNMKVIHHMSGTTHLLTASCSRRLDSSALFLWKLQNVTLKL